MIDTLVTRHALLRYLERVEEVDVAAYGGDLAAMRAAGVAVAAARSRCQAIAERARSVGAAKIVHQGFEYILTAGVLVTVSPRRRGGLAHAGKGKRVKRASARARLGAACASQRRAAP